MRLLKSAAIFIFILALAWLALLGHQVEDKETLYQVSVLDALMKGDYDGTVTLDKVRLHGDLGIGTFDRLDGEAIELDGYFYQAAADGKVRRLSGNVKTPFFMTTPFGADRKFPVDKSYDAASLQRALDGRLPTKNIPYAIRVDGKFGYIKIRSVPAQDKPYPPLAEVVKNQSVFEFRDIEGTLVGFRMPACMSGVNMPGYHMHFISRDRTKGGHVLAYTIDSGEAGIDDIDRFILYWPRGALHDIIN